MASKTMLWSER